MGSLQTAASVFAIITGIAAILTAAYVLFRSRTAEVLRGERDAYQEKCERLNDELKICIEESHAKDIEITDLRAKTDLSELTKGQAAVLANQAQMLAAAVELQTTLGHMTHVLEAMEQRLAKGLVMS